MTRFHSCHKNATCFQEFRCFLATLSRSRDICMDFEACLKIHTLITVQRKRINLGQMIHHNMIFYVVVSNYQQVKHTVFEIFPSSLDNLKMAYIPWLQGCSSLFQFVVFCWTNLLISARQIKKESNVTSKHTRPWQVVMIRFTYKIIYLSLDLKTVNVTEQNVLMLS